MAAKSRNKAMADRIAQAMPRLSSAHRKVAEYVRDHPLQTATMPIDELAATAGVSVATANRFARALDFEGYAQFRASLVLGFETALAPVERLRSELEHPSTTAGVFAAALDGIGGNVAKTAQSLEPRACERAVDAILGAKRVYVLGFGSSSWLGGLLQRSLVPIRDDVFLLASIEGPSAAARVLPRLTPRDLLIAIAFPRYFSDTAFITRLAHEAGVPVLALTDRPTSPLVPHAAVILYAHTQSPYFANSEASVLALIEALCSAVSHRAKDSLKGAAQLADAVLPWLLDKHAGRPHRRKPANRRAKGSPARKGADR